MWFKRCGSGRPTPTLLAYPVHKFDAVFDGIVVGIVGGIEGDEANAFAHLFEDDACLVAEFEAVNVAL